MGKLKTSLLFSTFVLLSPLAVQANTAHPLYEQIQFYEYSVTQSSVSPTISEQRKTEKLALLDEARRQVESGNYPQARGLMKEVAQNLYSMSPEPKHDQALLTIHKTTAILRAMDSLLPEAHRIALEKHAGSDQLEQIKQDHQRAKAAIRSHDLVTASALLQSSYQQLKQNLSELRSGDLLIINLPAANSREGWMDAASRYIDWRYLNTQLLQEMRQRGMSTIDIDQAKENADHLYNSASDIALQGNWEQAVETADQAYRILEKAWRDTGIDIGV
jgi:tetratricopeptide (TPR) repeat protein